MYLLFLLKQVCDNAKEGPTMKKLMDELYKKMESMQNNFQNGIDQEFGKLFGKLKDLKWNDEKIKSLIERLSDNLSSNDDEILKEIQKLASKDDQLLEGQNIIRSKQDAMEFLVLKLNNNQGKYVIF